MLSSSDRAWNANWEIKPFFSHLSCCRLTDLFSEHIISSSYPVNTWPPGAPSLFPSSICRQLYTNQRSMTKHLQDSQIKNTKVRKYVMDWSQEWICEPKFEKHESPQNRWSTPASVLTLWTCAKSTISFCRLSSDNFRIRLNLSGSHSLLNTYSEI